MGLRGSSYAALLLATALCWHSWPAACQHHGSHSTKPDEMHELLVDAGHKERDTANADVNVVNKNQAHEVAQDYINAHTEVANSGPKVPLKLHYIYLSGFDAYVAETEKPRARMQKAYYDSCVAVHPHWEIMFWDMAMAEALVREHYAWFLPYWDSYDMEVKKADASRIFILHHYGGMYLDLDIECYRPAENAFKHYDVVLQGTGFEGVNNGMMASAPGHPIWMALIDVLIERCDPKGDIWHNSPIYMTGPSTLTLAMQRYLKLPQPVSGFLGGEYHVDNTIIKLYSIGEFFVPCWGSDIVCTRRFEKDMAKGSLDWDDPMVVGRHWFAGSWNKPALLAKVLPPKKANLPEVPPKKEMLATQEEAQVHARRMRVKSRRRLGQSREQRTP